MGGKAQKQHKQHKHHKTPKPAAEPEILSFEALARDLPPASISLPQTEPMEEVLEREEKRQPYESTRHHEAFDHGPLTDREALNARVLTGSASAGIPTWISGLGLAVFAWLICFAARGESGLPLQGAILSVVAFMLSLGAVVWTAPGALIKEAVPLRTRSRLALGVGAGGLIFSAALVAAHWL